MPTQPLDGSTNTPSGTTGETPGVVSSTRYVRNPHPGWSLRRAKHPIRVDAQHNTGTGYSRFNTNVAIATTRFVGSMNCAWLFAVIALISLPAALSSGSVLVIVSWVAQTFLQLVLLSVIMVGQNVQSTASDKLAEQTFTDTEFIMHELMELHRHIDATDNQQGADT